MAIALRVKLITDEETTVPGKCRDVSSFEMLQLLGEGANGKVRKAKNQRTREIVALKQLILQVESYKHEGFPPYAIREIKILNKLRNENIIGLKEVVTAPDRNGQFGNVYMVFEYMDHDLSGLARRFTLSIPQIKCYMKQLLTGLHYCHINRVLHRDIKSANLLVNNQGCLKIADFGLARNIPAKDCGEEKGRLTSRVVMLWYRAPELLLGARDYSTSVDMWSVGCVFSELLSGEGRSIFDGIQTEAEMIGRIVEICGAPDERNWPGVTKMQYYDTFMETLRQKKKPDKTISEVFGHCGREAVELLEKFLTLDPSKRISAADALDSDYFWNDPMPCDPESLSRNYKSSHELDIKMEYEKHKLQPQNAQHGLKHPRSQHEEKHDDVKRQKLHSEQRFQKPVAEKRQEIDAQQQLPHLQNEEQHVVKRPVNYQQCPLINARNEHDANKEKLKPLQEEQHLLREFDHKLAFLFSPYGVIDRFPR